MDSAITELGYTNPQMGEVITRTKSNGRIFTDGLKANFLIQKSYLWIESEELVVFDLVAPDLPHFKKKIIELWRDSIKLGVLKKRI